MSESIMIALALAGILLIIIILLIYILVGVKRFNHPDGQQEYAEALRLLQKNQEALQEGFAQSRREWREMSAENRRENLDVFNRLQDTLLNRIAENSQQQNQQLALFKTAFGDLSEKLITNANEFKESVGQSFLASSEALNVKQDEFREKTLSRLDGFAERIQKDAKDNRTELNVSLKSFESQFAESSSALLNRIAENSQQQNQQLALFKTAFGDLSEKLITNANEFKESVGQSFLASSEALNVKQDEFREKTLSRLDGFAERIQKDAKDNRTELNLSLKSFESQFAESTAAFSGQLAEKFADLQKHQAEASAQAKTSISEIRDTIDKQLRAIREDNTLQLNEMRKTVDEKLQGTLEKRLGESFKQVSDRLEQVHKGLGEMQSLAIGVGDLKKVLSNVKTRGILGEYQLGNILEQVLSPEQYATNVATKQGSQANVEFAVKLPGKADEKIVWLPMDSKFPLESYQMLLQAYEEGDLAKIDVSQKALLKAVESFAKDISGKYIDPPHTTDFAIMFLPIESLFAEVLRHPQVFERLQRHYRITITGPTTLSALLNSLHMGFRTLAVQQRSSEVWKVLAEVKTEFATYSEQLALVHKQLTTASGSLEKLKDTRTKAMARKLNQVSVLALGDDQPVLPLLDN